MPALWLFVTGFTTDSKPVTYIALQNQSLNIAPKEFYIANVEDARPDNTNIGALLPVSIVPGKPALPYLIDLKGGIAAVKNFAAYSLPANKTLRPISIKLNEFKVTESPLTAGAVKGEIRLSLSFFLQKSEEKIHLINYSTTTNYQHRVGPAQQIEPLLRNMLGNSIIWFNNWVNMQAQSNIKLAKNFKIKFTDYREPIEGDTIYYSAGRPFTWNDFKGKAAANTRHAAETFAGLGYDEDIKVENSTIYMTLAIKVYAPKSACWVNSSARTAANLNHEQRHFDIARLVAEHYKQNIVAENPTPDTYDAIISMGYLDALREMNKLQRQYDAETAHSNDTYQQNMWDNKIDGELAAIGVKSKAL